MLQPNYEVLEKLEEIESNLASTDLDATVQEDVRGAVEAFKRASAKWQPFQELHELMFRVSDYLDDEADKRQAIDDRLRVIESDTRQTLSVAKIVAVLFAATVGFWSVVAWWALNDEINALFHAIGSLFVHTK